MVSRRFPQYLHEQLDTQVRDCRMKADMSQEELAVQSGLHRTYIGAVERGERNVGLATLEALATGLSCDPRDLI